MSAVFAKLRTCTACTGAGYGWCPMRRRCGGFANKECGVGEAYMAEGETPLPTSKDTRESKRKQPAGSSGTDMRAMFAQFRSCEACTNAGYGWCPLQRKCGGFANKECGIGPNYFTASPEPRNGLWEPKAKRKVAAAAEQPAAADVPAASPPPPAEASLLYAGPARPPSSPMHVAVDAADASTTTTSARLTNETDVSSKSATSPEELDKGELMRLSREALVSRVLELQSEVHAMRRV